MSSTTASSRPDPTNPAHSLLPQYLTGLVGRDSEIAALRSLLFRDEVRLVTLVGPGGVGKTRLALRLAEETADSFDDAIFVDLSTLTDPELAVPTIARAFGVQDAGVVSILPRLVLAVENRAILLVIDNLEQITGAGPSISELLRSCPTIKVVATSRVPLRVSGEQQFPVAPLDPASAASLFEERARAVRPAFSATGENVRAIATVCHELDGLPLAIELAAARSKVLSPQALLARLSQGLGLLSGGPRDQPARLRTMRDAIAWSHDLLTDSERDLFRRLTVFSGGFSLEAAETVCGGVSSGRASASVLDDISALVDGSLLRQVESPTGESRFEMLETIREFGLEQLNALGEADELRERHAAWCSDLTESAWPSFVTRVDQDRWLDQLELENDNLRSAMRWLESSGRRSASIQLTGSLCWFWYVRGYLSEGRAWLERALALDGDEKTTFRARALLGLGMMTHWQGDDEHALPALRESLAVSREIGDSWGATISLGLIGLVAEDQGDFAGAEPILREALALARAEGDLSNTSLLLDHLGIVAWGAGDADRAIPLWEEALQLQRSIGDDWGLSISLSYLGMVACERRDFSRSRETFRESLAQRWSMGTKEDIAHGLANFGALASAEGEYRLAARLFGAAEAVQAAIGNLVKEPERSFYEQAIGETRARLGKELDEEWAAGRAARLDEIVSEALAHSRESSIEPASPAPGAQVNRSFSSREIEVLRLLVAGYTDKRIGEALFISYRTAQVHVANILAKYGVSTRVAAVTIALREGIVGAPPEA